MSEPRSDVAPLTLEWLPGRYAICRLNPDEAVPAWVQAAAERSAAAGAARAIKLTIQNPQSKTQNPFLFSITRTDRELSIVMDESRVPPDVKAERGFIAMRLVGVIDMTLVGIFAKLTGALAAAKVPVFVMSTYDTDYLLVREQCRDRAIAALSDVATFM